MSVRVRGLSTIMYDSEKSHHYFLRDRKKQSVRGVVPDVIQEIHRWLRVRSRLGIESDPDFPVQVVYRRCTEDVTLKRVVLRVHGTYVDGRLSKLGDNGE